MISRKSISSLLCGIFLVVFVFACPAFAEVKVFEQEVEEAVSRGQSQEQVEAFALQKAKRLAVEEAGTYISSLTIVRNYQLQSDEVTALASGVVQAKIVGVPTVRVENGVVHVKVKARIDVDTSVLDRQVQAIMKEKGTLKKLEDERKKNKDLEEKLANLKSTEVKRLEELNAQAIALERERDRQRLFREEQALKARGELSKAQADRIAKEREMQARINQTLVEQEKAKRDEAAALAAEQDKIKRAQLENEQRWNDLSRQAKLSQDSWTAIDDSLSFKQAVEEVKGLKAEITNLRSRLDYQYRTNTANLKKAYTQQRALSGAKLPSHPAPKDAFESTAEYNRRIAVYERQVKEAQAAGGEVLGKLEKEETLKLAEAKVDYLGQQIRMLTPFVERLGALQARKFTLPESGAMTVELGDPDPDNSRFPLAIKNNGQFWSFWWNYSDKNSARDFFLTRTHLKAEGLYQIEEVAQFTPILTAAKITHLATKETREFLLQKPITLIEIDQFADLKGEEAIARENQKQVSHELTKKANAKDGPFIAYDDGTVLDTRTNLMWAAKDNGRDINWANAKSYCKNYRGGGYTDWRMPTQDELAALYDKNKKSRHGYNVTDLIEITDYQPWASETRGDNAKNGDLFNGGRGWQAQWQAHGSRALPVRSVK